MSSTQIIRRGIMLCAVLVFVFSAQAFAFQITAGVPGGSSISLDVQPTDTIANVKTLVESQITGLPASKMDVTFNGVVLLDTQTIAGIGIQAGQAITVTQKAPVPSVTLMGLCVIGMALLGFGYSRLRAVRAEG